jgi:hypothetical protein
MSGYLAAAGMLAQAAGTGLQAAGASQANRATKGTWKHFQEQMDPLESKGIGAVTQAATSFGMPAYQQQLAAAQGQRGGAYNDILSIPTGYGFASRSNPSDRAAMNMAAQQRAAQMAYGDVGVGQNLALSDVSRKQMHWNSIAQAYLDQLYFDLMKAQQAGSKEQEIGSILSAIGGSAMGGSGGFK